MIHVEPLSIPGPLLLRPEVNRDKRGFFAETARADGLAAAGIQDEFVLDSHSRSVRGTIRGLHFQALPGQAKLVRVARGIILDVVVDVRPGSDTFGRNLSIRLDDVELCGLYIPRGFAHGFCVLSDEADVVYRMDGYFDSDLERGIAWDDPALAISWPVTSPILSDRDRQHPTLAELFPRRPLVSPS